MIRIAHHKMFAHPLPEGHRFPMLKYELIPEQLLYEGSIEQEQLFEPGLLEEEIIVMTHEKAYWEKLRDLTLSDREQRRIGFPLSPELVEREVRIASGTIEAAISALRHKIAFNVAGGTHHAGRFWGEGFCLLNDQAIAANYLLNKCLCDRILIIDLDVHQGNGTAEIFGKVPQVFTFSMHGDKNFPFRKEQSDLDVPLENGMGDEAYLQLLEQHLKKAFLIQQPDFVFYLSGVDVLATDKLGKLALSKAGCKERDRIVLQYCKDLGVPLQISMGGGYSADIKDIVDAHCNTFRLAADLFG
ncbi:histone deacetylase family protein [Pedobacter nutrimenti]|uniref:Acetoin utilization deacetylase AcuC-like enzyme n=1 Tax=Pedobacter nutrimenti TaxID=1241337 RepID=A0A318UZ68_9SPHI|nr:histone deacetylase [Pedobacter nutrimenti]PYF76889.1 acetoin utilization deacetylase AcuC-like enzyme [Pedobacter nutrimenti]